MGCGASCTKSIGVKSSVMEADMEEHHRSGRSQMATSHQIATCDESPKTQLPSWDKDMGLPSVAAHAMADR